jgi:hypothetical protein
MVPNLWDTLFLAFTVIEVTNEPLKVKCGVSDSL